MHHTMTPELDLLGITRVEISSGVPMKEQIDAVVALVGDGVIVVAKGKYIGRMVSVVEIVRAKHPIANQYNAIGTEELAKEASTVAEEINSTTKRLPVMWVYFGPRKLGLQWTKQN